MFVTVSRTWKKCQEICQNDHNCEYAIWEPHDHWRKNECQLYAVGTSMCSTDENSKLSVDLVKKEIYEEDKDFNDFDIDENGDDLPRVLDGPPKLIQCTSKVRLFDFLLTTMHYIFL